MSSNNKKDFVTMVYDVVADVVFFRDKNDTKTIYGEYYIDGTDRKFSNVLSNEFKAYVRMIIHNLKYKITESSVIQYIQDAFTFDNSIPLIEPNIRIAGGLRTGIEYALNDSNQNIVYVDSEGWNVAPSTANSFFISYDHMLPQVKPKRTTKSIFDLLAPYVNLVGDSFILFVIWLICTFASGNNSISGLLVDAEKGSGKTFLSRIIRELSDPSKLDVTIFPTKIDELITLMVNTKFISFDNITQIPKEHSNILCVGITAGTTTKRSLFTTNELSIFKLNTIIVLNGIGVALEDDLAQRCLYMKLPTIDEKKRKEADKLWDGFEADKPEILGAIFDVLSKAMSLIDTIKIDTLPRMASSFVSMAAIAAALDISLDEFTRIYNDNVTAMNKARADSPFVVAIREYMNSPLVPGRKAEALASKMLSNVRSIYSGDKNSLPKSASIFSQQLKADRDTLEIIGYKIFIDDTYSDGTHISIIKSKNMST